ncbi:MAG: hypothetical protein MUF45_05420 [Spirosomaceae bacterium]|jgi:hypothetical protein|nr:hypothetical protein [Spirosomataceae bacterium]
MKKLFFIVALLIVSYGSMAMGFPHNTNTHHRLHVKANSKVLVTEKASAIVKNKISDKVSNNSDQHESSFVEIFINYVFKLFCREVSKSSNSLTFNEGSIEMVAIKQDLDLSLRS